MKAAHSGFQQHRYHTINAAYGLCQQLHRTHRCSCLLSAQFDHADITCFQFAPDKYRVQLLANMTT